MISKKQASILAFETVFEIVAEHPENKLECKNQFGVGFGDQAGTGQT